MHPPQGTHNIEQQMHDLNSSHLLRASEQRGGAVKKHFVGTRVKQQARSFDVSILNVRVSAKVEKALDNGGEATKAVQKAVVVLGRSSKTSSKWGRAKRGGRRIQAHRCSRAQIALVASSGWPVRLMNTKGMPGMVAGLCWSAKRERGGDRQQHLLPSSQRMRSLFFPSFVPARPHSKGERKAYGKEAIDSVEVAWLWIYDL